MSRPQLWHQVYRAHTNTLSPVFAVPYSIAKRPRLLSAGPWQFRGEPTSSLGNINVSRPHKFRANPQLILVSAPLNRLSVRWRPMAQRRPYSTKKSDNEPTLPNGKESTGHSNIDGHDDLHDTHSHSHSHSLFGHSHGEEGHSHGTEQIIAALEGQGTRHQPTLERCA